MRQRSRIALIVAVVALFGAGGIWLAMSMTPHRHERVKVTDEQGKVYYTCPMHPQVKQDQPGSCPICGMQLVKAEKEGAGTSGDEGAGVRIDPGVVQNLGIRTARVKRGTFFQRVDAVGNVEVDERRIVVIESRATGWVEALWVRSVGEQVALGQRLAGVYSADLFAAQQELVLAARSGDQSLISASRQRLSLLGLSAAQIDAVVRNRKAQRQAILAAPANGVVTELNVREGQQVTPGTPLLRLADLSRVWVICRAYGSPWNCPRHRARGSRKAARQRRGCRVSPEENSRARSNTSTRAWRRKRARSGRASRSTTRSSR
jgi:membrane fusion protein, copper/silver efflux system